MPSNQMAGMPAESRTGLLGEPDLRAPHPSDAAQRPSPHSESVTGEMGVADARRGVATRTEVCEPRPNAADAVPSSAALGLFVSSFFDELYQLGVRDVVVSPGSRSTPLAMVAFASELNLYLDVDERGAAFFALGLAKASSRPVCLVCTSGTAVANYYPAVMEAESSRVPLLVLTADRPPRLWGLGAPQTCDQLNAYGGHVRLFRQMPLPGASAQEISFARQSALEAYCAAAGAGAPGIPLTGLPGDAAESAMPAPRGCMGAAGPVQLNFPFDNPLKPDLTVEGLFAVGRRASLLSTAGDAGACKAARVLSAGPGPLIEPAAALTPADARRLLEVIRSHDTLVLAGEGSVACEQDACDLLALAEALALPIVADPLSGLRSYADPHILSAYDEVFGTDARPRAGTGHTELVVRFGRYPVSKACFTTVCAPDPVAGERPAQIVVDAVDTRDFNVATDAFVRCDPPAFTRSLLAALIAEGEGGGAGHPEPCEAQQEFLLQWRAADAAAASRLAERADEGGDSFEGAYVRRLLELAPRGSLLWAASSMSIRALDQFYRLPAQAEGVSPLAVLCNRGLNGIDGTVSSALGAAQCFEQTTLLIGDLALLHDLNALHMQRELLVNHGGERARSVVVVLLNNAGGGIFDLLPQRSAEPYFERLFLTPQQVNFEHAAAAFGVPYRRATTLDEFTETYRALLGTPGISLLEVPFSLSGTRERYRHV